MVERGEQRGRAIGVDLAGRRKIGGIFGFAVGEKDDGAVGAAGHEVGETAIREVVADLGEPLAEVPIDGGVAIGGGARQGGGVVGADGGRGDAGVP